jgi:hypothetical protein
MMESLAGCSATRFDCPVPGGRLQQSERPHDIGLNEWFRPEDRTIDMGLGGEMNDRVDPIPTQQVVNQRTIPDIPLNEGVPLGSRHVDKILGPTRVGQRIKIDDLDTWSLVEQVPDEIGADETGAPGHKYILHG